MSNANPYSEEANMFVGMAVHSPAAPPPAQADLAAPQQPTLQAVDPFTSRAATQPQDTGSGFDWGNAELTPFANAPTPDEVDKDGADTPQYGFYSSTGNSGAKHNVGFDPLSWDEEDTAAHTTPSPNQQMQQKRAPPPPPSAPVPEAGAGDAEAEVTRFEKTSKCWKLGFYQQFFDVDTEHVAARLIDSFVVTRRPDYLPAPQDVVVPAIREEGATRPTPPALPLDMYGPLWVSTTLWIALAVFGYLATEFASTGSPAPTVAPTAVPATPIPGTTAPATMAPTEAPALLMHAMQVLSDTSTGKEVPQWVFDFSWVLMSIAVSYAYVVGAPVLLWLLLHWLDVKITLPALVSLFGYSMAPLVATSAVCIIPVGAVRWTAVAVGSTYAFAVIGSLLYNYCLEMTNNGKLTVLATTALAHYVAATLLFFQILKI